MKKTETTCHSLDLVRGSLDVLLDALRQHEVTTAGTSAGTEPTYPTTPGNTVTDGTMVLTCRQLETG